MSNHEWEPMNENDFETMPGKSASGPPPDDAIEEAAPWRRSMSRVLIGMVLCAVTLNFWCLNYILPAIGMILSLLGFRTLWHENKWFGGCFIITVIRTAYFLLVLVLNTTIIPSTILTSQVTSILNIASMLLLLATSFCLWRGLRAAQRKVDLPVRAGGVAAMIICYALMCILAVIRYNGLIIAVAIIIGYIVIVCYIYRLSKELDKAGYAIQTASIKATDKCIVIVLLSCLVIGSVFGYLFGGSYSMDWSQVESSEQTEVEEIKNRLIELGFPENVLNDLAPENIAACDGALQVVVDITDEAVDDGRSVNNTEYKSPIELRITGVGVQIPGEREKWIIFHHFLWSADPGFYGTESIQLWPVYQIVSEGWASSGETSGRVMYDKDGETFAAPYYSLENKTYTSNKPYTLDSIFWGEQTSTDVFATFSMPKNGENYRGYIAYPILETQDGYTISSWVNYTHQRSRFQYPVMTAMEKRMSNSNNSAGAFITVWEELQF